MVRGRAGGAWWTGRAAIAVGLVSCLIVSGCADGSGTDRAATTSVSGWYDGPDAAANTLTADDLPPGFVAYPNQRPRRRADEPPAKVDDSSGLCDLANPADASDPLDRVQVGYSQRTGGPFLYETVAIFADEAQAKAAYTRSASAFESCIENGAEQQPAISGSELDVSERLGGAARGWTVAVDGVTAPTEPVGMRPVTTTTAAMSMEAGMARTGRFYVECAFSHRAVADPIVFPSSPGASAPSMEGHDMSAASPSTPGMFAGMAGHSHDFFGADSTQASSTTQTLLDGGTTCVNGKDKSAYWVPTLYRDGVAVEPLHARAWYSVPDGMSPDSLEPLPNGLQLIAGDLTARTPQSTEVVGWRCGDDVDALATDPPDDCTDDQPLTLQLRFADCWDGSRLSSADHRSHVAYADGGRCPASHPVAVPQIQMVVNYGLTGPADGLLLAMGPTIGAHGDAFVAWVDDEQQQLIDRCLVTMTDCARGSGPTDLPAFVNVVIMRSGATIVMIAAADFEEIDSSLTIDIARKAIARIPTPDR